MTTAGQRSLRLTLRLLHDVSMQASWHQSFGQPLAFCFQIEAPAQWTDRPSFLVYMVIWIHGQKKPASLMLPHG